MCEVALKLDQIELQSMPMTDGQADYELHMNWLSLWNNQLKFKTLGKLPIILEQYMEYILKSIKENPEDVNM
jgi:hypothetical protein